MADRKFTAEKIFTGTEMLSGSVLMTDSQGKVKDIISLQDAGDDIERFEGILSPGFVNCHCHLELSYLKGLIPPGTGMVGFILSVMGSRNHPLETIQQAIAGAEQEMMNAGVVAVGDICNTSHTVLQKQRQQLYYHNFIEASGFVDATAESRFRQAVEISDTFRGAVSLVPHAPYSVSKTLFRLIGDFQSGSLLTIHNQESQGENELFQSGSGDFLELYRSLGIDVSDFRPTGRTSMQSFMPLIPRNHSLLLVHNTVTGRSDIDWLSDNDTFLPELYWCLCPNANLHINNMLADVPLLASTGHKIVVGTDSLASNNQLSILEELKTLQRYFPVLSTAELLRWATINGAQALKIDGSFGSFSKGLTPGIVHIRNAGQESLQDAFSQRLL